MELRHLRYFVAVAEELHFARAAERLHIEQSPLSRAIRDLECRLGARLFERTTRSTQITWAGQVLLEEARRILASIDQLKLSVRAASRGYRDFLRVGVSDDLVLQRVAKLIACCQENEPEVDIRLFEFSFSQQIHAIRSGLLDVGFILTPLVNERIHIEPIWTDPLVVVLPVDYPIAMQNTVQLEAIAQQPLVLFFPDEGAGCRLQIEQLLHQVMEKLHIAEQVTSLSMMLTLVGAGRGVGFALSAQMETISRSDVVVRRLSGRAPTLTTYVLRHEGEPSSLLTRFCDRARVIV